MIIKTANFIISAPDTASCPEPVLPEFAFVGRSNVGKSSLLNMLCRKKGLAKVSGTPGHTRLINFFKINETWTMVDLPGYGYARGLKSDRTQFERLIVGYLENRANLRCVFVLIDARHLPQKIDLEFVQWLTGIGVKFVLVFTKADKLKPTPLQANINEFKTEISHWCEETPEVFATSSETGAGRMELLRFISGLI